MNSAKQAIADLVEICFQKGVRKVVISPGSRNAPIADGFLRKEGIECLSIVDERSAGFFALGMAQQLNSPVALLCTSGSAVLNYAPAIAEAFYQRIPLLIITADRPKEWVNQGESQTIDQNGIFTTYIKASYQLPQNPASKNDFWYFGRQVSEAINCCQFPTSGPVHLNMAIDEPLYEKTLPTRAVQTIEQTATVNQVNEESLTSLIQTLNQTSRVMVLAGIQHPNPILEEALIEFSNSPAVVTLTETTSNLQHPRFFSSIDKVLAVALANEQEETAPQLLITIGHQVISKKIKAFLRKTSLIAHWHIDTSPAPADTYQQLSHFIPVLPETFFKQLNANYQPPTSAYYQHWNSFRELATKRHHAFLEQAPFSDLQAFDQLLTAIPENTHIQMGNSSTVRYIQLFDQQQGAHYFSNRGTSGIEGSVSTAVGATWATKHQTVLIVGDLSFLYDQNGLWNNYLTPALKIIVINNAGGGIFRFIDGPDTVKDFETYLETSHKRNIEPVAQMYGLHYFCAKTKEELKNQLPLFFASQATTTSVLEVCTPRLENATLLKSYFHHLTHGK